MWERWLKYYQVIHFDICLKINDYDDLLKESLKK